MLMGGFPYVVEAVGSPRTVTDALRAVAQRGTVLMLGVAGISEVDLTPVWYKEAALSRLNRPLSRYRVSSRTRRRTGPSLDRQGSRHSRCRTPPRRSRRHPRIPARRIPRCDRDRHRQVPDPRDQGRLPSLSGCALVGDQSVRKSLDSNETLPELVDSPYLAAIVEGVT